MSLSEVLHPPNRTRSWPPFLPLSLPKLTFSEVGKPKATEFVNSHKVHVTIIPFFRARFDQRGIQKKKKKKDIKCLKMARRKKTRNKEVTLGPP